MERDTHSLPRSLFINPGYPMEGICVPLDCPLPNPAYIVPNLLQNSYKQSFNRHVMATLSTLPNFNQGQTFLPDMNSDSNSNQLIGCNSPPFNANPFEAAMTFNAYNGFGLPGMDCSRGFQQFMSAPPNFPMNQHYCGQRGSHSRNPTPVFPGPADNSLGAMRHPFCPPSFGGPFYNNGYMQKNRHHRQHQNNRNNPKHGDSPKDNAENSKKPKKVFDPYCSEEEIISMMKERKVIKGQIRINAKNFKNAYVAHPNGDCDIFIPSVNHRNRALQDDIVAVQLEPRKKWRVNDIYFPVLNKGDENEASSNDYYITLEYVRINHGDTFTQIFGEENMDMDLESNEDPDVGDKLEGATSSNNWWKYVQRTGKVVYILKKLNFRKCVGYMKPFKDQQGFFEPVDHRIPRLVVAKQDCPPEFLKNPSNYKSIMLIARILEWPEDGIYARGVVECSLPNDDPIECETTKILVEYGVDCSPFPESACSYIKEFRIPDEEFTNRRDMRQECIFTIDPSTARDLDDAIHIKELPEEGPGVVEVGVHIADVSFFLPANSELDKIASERATTCYLVQRAVSMLPRELCEDKCSLNPNEDKMAFSVIWKLDADANIIDTWFGKTIIRSCCKLSYQQAQRFINEDDWSSDELPHIYEPFNAEMLQKVITLMIGVTRKIRNSRIAGGSLRLDQTKIGFTLCQETGLPEGFHPQLREESCFMIEELMLLANMSVAKRLYESLPDIALLRRHQAPSQKALDDLLSQTTALGVPVDITSSKAMQVSINRCLVSGDTSSNAALLSLCSKAMQLAQYFCTGSVNDEADFVHYALNVPFYTHFTSPIRRYADVVVHRQLAAILTSDEISVDCLPESIQHMTTDWVQGQSEWCNKKKKDAKLAGEASCELFYTLFVRECGGITEECVVMNVLNKSFDVLILRASIVKRVYCEQMNLDEFSHVTHDVSGCGQLKLIWSATDSCQHQISTVVKPLDSFICELSSTKSLKLEVKLQRPDCKVCIQ